MSTRLERLIALDAYISRGGYPGVRELCRAFELQPRTLHQDIKDLRERFGLDIRFSRDHNGYYKGSPLPRLPVISLSREQVLLCIVALEMLCRYGGASFRGAATPVFDAIAGSQHQHLLSVIPHVLEIDVVTDAELSCAQFLDALDACLNGGGERSGAISAHLKPKKLRLQCDSAWLIAEKPDGSAHEIQLAAYSED